MVYWQGPVTLTIDNNDALETHLESYLPRDPAAGIEAVASSESK
ncbi:hypothetical protein AB0H42_30160 [Nocardia sp. NPDC050799]